MNRQRALWASTSTSTRGGVATFVRTMQATPLWELWNVRHVSTHRNGTVATKIVAFATGLGTFVSALVFDRPDVVHLHTSVAGSFIRKAILAWICRIFRVPVVMHVHGSDFHLFYGRSSRPVKGLIRATLTGADVVVALGDRWAERLERIAPQAYIVSVPNAVRPCRPVRQPSGREPVHVLFLGCIGDRKGTFTLLDAWAKMIGDGNGRARLTIAGDGEVQRARDRVDELSVGSTVTVLGWLAPDRVPELLASSQVLALPSRNEGQPMAILEAMAHGLCVVASAVGGIPELIDDHCGVLVPVDDVDALAQALRRVVYDDDARIRLGSHALQRIRAEFDVDAVWRRFDALYREVRR
ncbi:glycosyltransferase family 4 protein [Rhodococcus opacus]|uniref:glycosyltransferase family 4 protein n=1 Tax=Rhodococcus opacus TaxID=37919 RepID=UPI0029495601|nr:glycosyltransferase family 4 protein [Rhodococcus opacus]MDV6240656.1 glycosyltransferase family 4 protein [Rhodococcus opacus]